MEKSFFQWIGSRIRRGHYVLSKHAEIERQEEDIDIAEIESCLAEGVLLEDYAEDPRGHSCLIAGMTRGRWVHVVCGAKEDWVIIITVYIPKLPYWETPHSRGKR